MNPFLKRLAEQGTTGHGFKSEKRVVTKLGARPQPASGAMAGAKSDAIKGNFRLEMKSTTNQTMRLESGWLVKISQEAREHGQVPALVISFVNGEGKPIMRQDAEWVLVPLTVFEDMSK
jgi:hypothetical protein